MRGTHQIGLGASYIHMLTNFSAGTQARGSMTFNGSVSGLPAADFLLGSASSWSQGTLNTWYLRQNYISLYLQDTWKVNTRLTLNYGVRVGAVHCTAQQERGVFTFRSSAVRSELTQQRVCKRPGGANLPWRSSI